MPRFCSLLQSGPGAVAPPPDAAADGQHSRPRRRDPGRQFPHLLAPTPVSPVPVFSDDRADFPPGALSGIPLRRGDSGRPPFEDGSGSY